MPHDPYRALYIHIPFCRSRCGYCDFATSAIPSDDPAVGAYTEHLIEEIRRLSKEGELRDIETVYIGGGTPTHIGSKNLSQILYALGLSMHLTPEVECTIEGNPESIDERLVRDVFSLGANRISIGVQSFDDAVLTALGRPHDAAQATRAIEAASTRFDNVSVDLMCGLPGQTPSSFERDLERALSLGVKHVSVYPLTIEPGTPFDRAVRSGKLLPADDDVQADMMELAESVLSRGGLERYEVANYAMPGYESRHNRSYWTGAPYLGIGASAVTMTQNGERRMRVQDGRVIDDLSPQEMAAEDMMLVMRLAEGASDGMVENRAETIPRLPSELERLEKLGLVEHRSGHWRPTERGWICGNELYGALLDLSSVD